MSYPLVQTTPENRAAALVSPFGNGTDNSNVRTIDISTTTAGAFTVPPEWYGCLIVMMPIGSDAYWFFSEQDTVKPDASADGADPQLGWRLRDGSVTTEQVPVPSTSSATIFLLYDSNGDGGVGTARLWLKKASTP